MTSDPEKTDSNWQEKQRQAQARIAELERENREFAQQLVELEEVNSNLIRLYQALTRLHSTFDREEIFAIIGEVVINFAQAERFALFLLDTGSNRLRYRMGEGFDEVGDDFIVAGDDNVLGQVLKSEETYRDSDLFTAGSEDLLRPLLAVPLITRGQNVGVLAVYQWLEPKESLDPLQHQLLTMLAEHAASALFYALLYARSERKRQTYQDVVDLFIK